MIYQPPASELDKALKELGFTPVVETLTVYYKGPYIIYTSGSAFAEPFQPWLYFINLEELKRHLQKKV